MDHTSVEAAVTTDASSQQLQDIQSYLATFNKEIGDGAGTTITNLPPGQQLFVQNQGQASETVHQILGSADGVQSFIQTNADVQGGALLGQNNVDGTQTSVNVPFMPASMAATSGLGGIQPLPLQGSMLLGNQANQGQFVQNVGEVTPVVVDPGSIVMDNTNQQVQSNEEDQEESVILNTGNSYQTVTIVPTSEVNQSGEVSYVLIVSQPDEEKNNADMSVFDFKEEKGVTEGMEEEAMDEDGASTSEPKKSVAHLKFAAARRAPVTQLMCNYCNYTSAKRYLLTRHMKTHSEERPHKCNICDRGFKTIASLQNHINTHTGVKPHKCKECDSTFTTSGELVRHVRYRHTFEKPHKCPDCDYASVELSKLKRHIRSHTGERPYQCPHCSYASPDTYKLKRHLRIHTGEKPYECDICHARFTQSNSLKAHRLIHTGDKPVFQCELCPTTCGRKTDLKIHVQKLHTSEEPILCKKCGKSFPDRYTFKIHIKTHDGEKCFRCELCPYAAMSQRHLESHILTHTGEKPFKCDECDMSFRQKQLLRRHKNLYHTPDYTPPTPKEKQHQCVECGKNFAHRGNMLRHMAIHDPDNPLYQEINIMKVEEEEARQAMEIARMEAEECSDGIPEGEPDESFEQQNPRQVQVQLVNEEGEHAGQIYLQLENPDGTIPEGEPIPVTTASEGSVMSQEYTSSAPQQRTANIVKVEPSTSEQTSTVAIVQNIQEGIPAGEYDSTEQTAQVITTVSQANNEEEIRGGLIQQHQTDMEASFGFNQEEGISPGEN